MEEWLNVDQPLRYEHVCFRKDLKIICLHWYWNETTGTCKHVCACLSSMLSAYKRTASNLLSMMMVISGTPAWRLQLMVNCDFAVSSLLLDSDCSSVSLSVSALGCTKTHQQLKEFVALWKLKLRLQNSS